MYICIYIGKGIESAEKKVQELKQNGLKFCCHNLNNCSYPKLITYLYLKLIKSSYLKLINCSYLKLITCTFGIFLTMVISVRSLALVKVGKKIQALIKIASAACHKIDIYRLRIQLDSLKRMTRSWFLQDDPLPHIGQSAPMIRD